MTAIYNPTSFSFNTQINQPQLLPNQSYNPPMAQNIGQNIVHQNVLPVLQHIQYNNFLKSLPNIYNQPQISIPQLPQIQPIQQIQQIQPAQPVSKPLCKISKRSKKCSMAKPTLKAIAEDALLIPSPKSKSFIQYEPELNVRAPEFIPIQQNTTIITTDTYTKHSQFIPVHKARAKLNIYIPKQMTKKLLRQIIEPFPNANALYYYLDISTALQMNDKQIYLFTNNNNKQIGIINFDLHLKQSNELLYFIISPNDSKKIEPSSNKWLWTLDTYITAKQIMNQYNININDLPKSSRTSPSGINNKLQRQFLLSCNIPMNMCGNINWNNIAQIGSPKKIKKAKKNKCKTMVLNRHVFMNNIGKSWNMLSAIPIIVYENSDINNSKHWIEWIKFIYIEQENSYIGISFKYDNICNNWMVGSIYLDKGDIENKHRLVGANNIINIKQNYNKYFDLLQTSITGLIFD